jgi:hypothetical protein
VDVSAADWVLALRGNMDDVHTLKSSFFGKIGQYGW